MERAEKQPRRRKALLVELALVATALGIVGAVGAALISNGPWVVPEEAKTVENPVSPTEWVIEAGSKIYMTRCQSCHGANGDGKGEQASRLSVSPGNFTDSKKMDAMTDGELFWKITEGHRPMPRFKNRLTEEERWEVVDYIRTFAPKVAGDSSAVPLEKSDSTPKH